MKYVTSSFVLLVIYVLALPGCNWFSKKTEREVQDLSAEQRILYGVGVSPFVRKVRVVLHEKNIPYIHVPTLPRVLLQATNAPIPEDFAQASPLGKIPAYREENWTIADSSVISEYLEHAYPNTTALYPADSREYAQALWFEKYGDETLAGVTYKVFVERFIKPNILKQQPDEALVAKALKEELPPVLNYLEKALGDNRWIVGNNFSIADITLVTHFVSLQLVKEEVDEKQWPKLAAYIRRVLNRSSFQKALK